MSERTRSSWISGGLCLCLGLCVGLAGCDKQGASVEPEPGATQQEPAAPAGPALWTVSDEDTTVYLFGTVHILPPDTTWRYPALEAAFDEASVVYFEADVASAGAQARMLALIPELGVYGEGQTLSTTLEPDALATLDAGLAAIGVPRAAFDPMRPWLAGISMETQSLVARGYDPESGVEKILGAEAEAAGKELRFFETVEQQLRFFAGLPEAEQITFLVETAKAIVEEPEALDELVSAWAAGDVVKLAELVSDDDAMGSAAVAEVLLVNRNRDWVGQLQELMAAEPGVFFVAVGAAHLAGDDGVPTMLRAAGVEVSGP